MAACRAPAVLCGALLLACAATAGCLISCISQFADLAAGKGRWKDTARPLACLLAPMACLRAEAYGCSCCGQHRLEPLLVQLLSNATPARAGYYDAGWGFNAGSS